MVELVNDEVGGDVDYHSHASERRAISVPLILSYSLIRWLSLPLSSAFETLKLQ